MLKRLLLATGFLLSIGVWLAGAQQVVLPCARVGQTSCAPVSATAPLPVTGTFTPSGEQNVNLNQINGAAPSATNQLWVSPATGAVFTVNSLPRTSLTTAGCSVGVASAQCLAATTAQNWVQVQNTSTSASISCAWGGTAALNSSGSFMLAPGQSAAWGMMSNGIPNAALNCIASAAASPLYVEYH